MFNKHKVSVLENGENRAKEIFNHTFFILQWKQKWNSNHKTMIIHEILYYSEYTVLENKKTLISNIVFHTHAVTSAVFSKVKEVIWFWWNIMKTFFSEQQYAQKM